MATTVNVSLQIHGIATPNRWMEETGTSTCLSVVYPLNVMCNLFFLLCSRLDDFKWLSRDQFQDAVTMVKWTKKKTFKKQLYVQEGANPHGITRMKIHHHEQKKVRGHEHRLMSEKSGLEE